MTALLAATAIALTALVYALSCWLYPMRDCWCCGGAGHHRPKDDKGRHGRGQVSRPCRWCRRTGKRLRIGRRLANTVRRRRREGVR